jgi:hypothetical protein
MMDTKRPLRDFGRSHKMCSFHDFSSYLYIKCIREKQQSSIFIPFARKKVKKHELQPIYNWKILVATHA